MKKQLTKAISKKVFTLFFAAFIFVAQSASAYAQKTGDTSTAQRGAEISYEGVQGKNLIFNVAYKNELAEPFQLIITNDFNDVLYLKEYNSQPLNTKLSFTEVPENCKLTFSIKTGKKELSQAFKINSRVKTVEEYIVKGI